MKLDDFTLGCHGIPDRCYKINDKHMPFCARCLGASIGHIFCAICYFFYFLPPFYFSIIGLALMLADWYFQNSLHKYHSNFMRLLTGTIGGFSMGIIIWKTVDFILKMF